MPFDPRYIRFFELWNEGEFYDCHEILEDMWMETQSVDRPFYQGLIQSAAAFEHLKRGNASGCRKLLASALDKLEEYPPRHRGLKLREFIELLAEWQAKVELMHAADEVVFAASMLPALDIPQENGEHGALMVDG